MKKRRNATQAGFSLAETMIASVVLVVGLLSILSLLTYSLSTLRSAEEDLIAREKTKEGLEGVLSARDSAQITFDQIRNVSAGGIFVDGFVPIYDPPGPDGIPNTADDSTGSTSKLDGIVLPGPDGILGTADDVFQPLTNFKRKIEISDVTIPGSTDTNPNLRLVTVTVQYAVPQFGTKTYTTRTYVSRFR